jgi:phosphate transport system permease protein
MSAATSSAPAASTPVDLTGKADGARLRELGFQLLMLFALLVALGFLVALLWDILSQAVPFLNERGWAGFVTDPVSTRPESTGLGQAIVGSVQIGLITMGVAFPLGVATAVYLEEYAERNTLTRIVDINIRNLAGVPSIVYGLLGLAIFVELMSFLGGSSVLAGGLTLALLALPIVTIAAAEALRSVPRSLREGGYGLGATRWQVTKQLVLPNAAPGILTGMILALARAIGETAPLIVVGAATFLTNDVRVLTGWVDPFFTAIPIVVFNWARLPQPAWREQVAPSGILILLLFTLTLNAAAILLRNHFEKKKSN